MLVEDFIGQWHKLGISNLTRLIAIAPANNIPVAIIVDIQLCVIRVEVSVVAVIGNLPVVMHASMKAVVDGLEAFGIEGRANGDLRYQVLALVCAGSGFDVVFDCRRGASLLFGGRSQEGPGFSQRERIAGFYGFEGSTVGAGVRRGGVKNQNAANDGQRDTKG